jgi:hypothetical protein
LVNFKTNWGFRQIFVAFLTGSGCKKKNPLFLLLGGVFIVIFVGIALAVITLIVEYWYYKYKKPNSSVDSDMMAKQLQVIWNDSDVYFVN